MRYRVPGAHAAPARRMPQTRRGPVAGPAPVEVCVASGQLAAMETEAVERLPPRIPT